MIEDNKKNCKFCSESFYTKRKDRLFCSRLCKQKKYNIDIGHIKTKTMTAPTLGAKSELLVSAWLLNRGFDVYRSVSPSSACDIVAIKKEKVYKIDVKTCYKSNKTGNIAYSTNNSYNRSYKPDLYGLCERVSEEVSFVDENKKIVIL